MKPETTPTTPSTAYRSLQSSLRRLVSAFFRNVEVAGLENVPTDCGGVLVSWHPNGLIDPGLILTQFPGRVVFGARHGLFRWPLLGTLMRELGTVPIYRATDAVNRDPSDRRQANDESLDALATEIARGSFAALFPEGASHDEPYLLDLKTGAARLYYRASALSPDPARRPVIIPVGLHYDKKRSFRSRALVWFHPPIVIPPPLVREPDANESSEELRDRARMLTAEIERVLFDVVHATDDWTLHFLLHRVRKLVRAERALRAGEDPGKPGIAEKALGFARIRAGYYARLATHPEQVADLRRRVSAYDEDLRGLAMDDHHLDRDPRLASPWLAALLMLQLVLVFFLLPPVLVFGYLLNTPTALALWGLSKLAGRRQKDQATIKVLVGAIAFPATWLAAGILAAVGHAHVDALYPGMPNRPILVGALVAGLAAVGGAAALRYLRVARETARAVRVRLTRRRRRAAMARLRVERAELYEEIAGLAEGLDLPTAN